jgi:DNA-binding SARP family transcriptional activator/tetratricopeptide (TPR) repeat protein
MKVRLLGPVDVVVDGAARPVPGQRRKAVLAALALRPAHALSTDQLIEIVWGDAPPATAANTLQSHMSFLRRTLGDHAAIRARQPGYSLDLPGEATDVQTAERLIRQGVRSADPRQGAAWLQSALDLWRGRPLDDIADLPWFDDHARRLDQLHLHAQQSLMQARLALGQHAQLVTDLEGLRRRHPLHEEIHGLLILALYRCGRQADALTVYQRLRQTLGDELGIEPGPALRALHTAVLHQDPSLDAPADPSAASASSGAATGPPRSPRPAQLPLALASFSGRDGELALLDAQPAADGGAAVVTVLSGTAGVGKSALAVHWAHRVRDSFPDGQLYVNLRGFDPGGRVMDPDEAMRGFLDALGVPAARVPAGLDAQTGLYRSLLAERRVLVVLDNARDADQVRPLLPAAPGCLALVTSRDRLTGLAVIEGARLLTLGLLDPAAARALLAGRLGRRRVAAEPDAVDEIVARCAGLPLALAIVAARAAVEPRFPLAALADGLRETAGRLDALDGGDPASQVRAVFSWSYRALSADAARLFRLLGLHPGPDITPPAAAALALLPPARTTALLGELTRGHLLTERAPGRYAFHDLLRAYAGELAAAHESPDARHAATERMLDHYLHTALPGSVLLSGKRAFLELPAAAPGIAQELTDHQQALEWFLAERRVLLAAAEHAHRAGFDTRTWQLATALTIFLDRQGRGRELAAVQTLALDAARRRDDAAGQAHAQRGLGVAHANLDHPDEAETHYALALDLFRRLDDHAGQAHTHQNLAWLAGSRGRHREALRHNRSSLEHYRASGDVAGQAVALNNLGWHRSQLGEHRRALADCRNALDLLQQTGDLNGQAHTWDSLGYIHHRLGQTAQAVDCYRHALDLFHRTGDCHSEATALAYLGDTHHDDDDPDAAYEAWTRALAIFEELGHPDAEPLRVKVLKAAKPGSPAAG